MLSFKIHFVFSPHIGSIEIRKSLNPDMLVRTWHKGSFVTLFIPSMDHLDYRVPLAPRKPGMTESEKDVREKGSELSMGYQRTNNMSNSR